MTLKERARACARDVTRDIENGGCTDEIVSNIIERYLRAAVAEDVEASVLAALREVDAEARAECAVICDEQSQKPGHNPAAICARAIRAKEEAP